MNAQMQTQFDRVENALNTLIDSITSYNPSPAAATSLVAADEELTTGLDQLATHQANYNTLISLRATTAALDDRIKSTLTLLADTRKELMISTPVSVSPEDSHNVKYEDLLSFAQRLAPFTVPPTFRPPLPAPIENQGAGGTTLEFATALQEVVLQPLTPSAATNGTLASGTNTPQPEPNHVYIPSKQGTGKGLAALPPSLKAWLDPTATSFPFTPWPSEEVIRSGALAQIQTMLDRGEDPEGRALEPDSELRRKEERNREEDEEAAQWRAEMEQQRRRQSVVTRGQQWLAPASRQAAQESIFDFDLYKPEEDSVVVTMKIVSDNGRSARKPALWKK